MKKSIKFLISFCIYFSLCLASVFSEAPFQLLNNNWEFFWEDFIEPNSTKKPDLYVNLTDSWNQEIKDFANNKSGYGYGSYRFRLTKLDPKKEYALLMDESPISACNLIINGEQLCTVGKVGTNVDTSLPFVSPIYLTFFSDEKGNAEIIFHISNFHQHKGGIIDSLFFGEKKQLEKYYLFQNGIGWLVVGTLFILSCLNIILFLLSKNKENLYFSLLTFFLAARVGSSNFSIFSIAFKNFPYELLMKLDYLSIWAAPILLCFIILFTNKNQFLKKIYTKTIIGTVIGLGIITIFLPASASNYFLPFVEVGAIITILLILIYLLFFVKKKETLTILNILSVITLSISFCFDVFFTERINSYPILIYPLFFLVFAIFQFLNLAAQQSIMHNTQKSLLRNLKKINDKSLSFVPKNFLSLIGKDNVNKVSLGDYTECYMTLSYTNLTFATKWESELSAEQEYFFFSNCVSIMSPIVKKHNGYIGKIFTQDIICLFPNHPTDAIRCNIEITSALNHFLESPQFNSYKMKKATGIHHGKVLLGTIGEENRIEDAVISEAVNVVSRLSQEARKLNVDFLFSDDLFNIVKGNDFDFSQLGISSIKGKSRPISV